MYISLGDRVVSHRDIVGIFDLDRTSESKKTREFLNIAQKENRVILATDQIPVSFIVCTDGSVILSGHTVKNLVSRHHLTDK